MTQDYSGHIPKPESGLGLPGELQYGETAFSEGLAYVEGDMAQALAMPKPVSERGFYATTPPPSPETLQTFRRRLCDKLGMSYEEPLEALICEVALYVDHYRDSAGAGPVSDTRSSAEQLETLVRGLAKLGGRFVLSVPLFRESKWRAEILPDRRPGVAPFGVGNTPEVAIENLLRCIEGKDAISG